MLACDQGHTLCDRCIELSEYAGIDSEDGIPRNKCKWCNLEEIAIDDYHNIIEAMVGISLSNMPEFLRVNGINGIEELYKLREQLRERNKEARIILVTKKEIKIKHNIINLRGAERDKDKECNSKKRDKGRKVSEL